MTLKESRVLLALFKSGQTSELVQLTES